MTNLTFDDLERILREVFDVRVCVAGDLCLDIYWRADMRFSRLSRETPHFPLPVVEERIALGGGGNVMANVCALGVEAMLPVTVLGADWRGSAARQALAALGAPEAGVVTDGTRVTPCYAKPLRAGISDVVYEDPRLDFENYRPLSPETEEKVLRALEAAAAQADVIAVCDQLALGVVSARVRQAICALGARMPVIADSRDRIGTFTNVIVKPNALEAAAACGTPEDAPETALKMLSEKTGAPALITLGEGGALWRAQKKTVRVPGVKTAPTVDPVGAGDTFMAAFAAAYAAGESGPTAAAFANLAASVTVKKLGEAGVAAPAELREAFLRAAAEN